MVTQKEVHELVKKNGFWDEKRNTMELLALVHSEVSEAVEDVRNGKMNTYYNENGKPCGFPSELADIVLRVMDMCEGMEINLEEEIRIKHEYNKTRSYRHGGKLA